MPTNPRTPRSVLVAGGGVAGLEAVLALHAMGGKALNVTLISPDDELAYRPLSVAEPFGGGEVRSYRIDHLVARHGAARISGFAAAVDHDRRVVELTDGRDVAYDDLIVALGAERRLVYPEALTFIDQRNGPGYRELLNAVEAGDVSRIAFLVPPGTTWPFPLYELALMTAAFASERGLDMQLHLVTPATSPLALFGKAAQEAMAQMLAERGIELHSGVQAHPRSMTRVMMEPDGGALEVDRMVALPRLYGPRLPGLPHEIEGFIPVDDDQGVEGVSGVWAAGDCTTWPIKQGGLAAQQADLAAAAVCESAGLQIGRRPGRPVLRGMLLTGGEPTYLRAELDGTLADGGTVAHRSLWWPPTKIAGHYLAPALGSIDGTAGLAEPKGAVPIEIRLERGPAEGGIRRRAYIIRASDDDRAQVVDLGSGPADS